MVILSVMRGCASVVTLAISLARMSALLLDEYSLKGSSGAAVSDHDLLSVVQHLRIGDTTRARVLLLFLMTLGLLVGHIGLSVMVDALRPFAFLMNPGTFD